MGTAVDAFVEADEGVVEGVIEETLGEPEEPETTVVVTADEVDFRLGATLKKAHVDYHTNGTTLTLHFEAGYHYAGALVDMPDGLGVTFDKLAVGEGAWVAGISVAKDPDGVKHLRFKLVFPQSELRKTRGRIYDLVGDYGLLILERMQQTLRLGDGAEIDLTKKAE